MRPRWRLRFPISPVSRTHPSWILSCPELCDQVADGPCEYKPLFVMGFGGSKAFYGNYRPVTPQDGHCLLDMTPIEASSAITRPNWW